MILDVDPPTVSAVEIFDALQDKDIYQIIQGNFPRFAYDLEHVEKEYEGWIEGYRSSLFEVPDGTLCAIDATLLSELYGRRGLNSRGALATIYGALLIAAPFGKCTYCDISEASSLDHIFPRSRYPWLSIVPSNLVPACAICNSRWGDSKDSLQLKPHARRIKGVLPRFLFAHVHLESPWDYSFRVDVSAVQDSEMWKCLEFADDRLGLTDRWAQSVRGDVIDLCDSIRGFGMSRDVKFAADTFRDEGAKRLRRDSNNPLGVLCESLGSQLRGLSGAELHDFITQWADTVR